MNMKLNMTFHFIELGYIPSIKTYPSSIKSAVKKC